MLGQGRRSGLRWTGRGAPGPAAERRAAMGLSMGLCPRRSLCLVRMVAFPKREGGDPRVRLLVHNYLTKNPVQAKLTSPRLSFVRPPFNLQHI